MKERDRRWTCGWRRRAGPSGERIIAALPPGILGGYGPELRRFIAAGHFQGQMTTKRLTALLTGMGLDISKRQVVRLLSQGLEDLIAEDQEVLRAGLETAKWITVDDTGARHGGKDGYVTHIGDNRFAVFRSSTSKSRKTFLSNLRAGRDDYVVNAEALAYMAERSLAGPLIAKLAGHPLINCQIDQIGVDRFPDYPYFPGLPGCRSEGSVFRNVNPPSRSDTLEPSLMAKDMEIVPSGELQKQFGRYSDEAMIRPVGVSRNGRLRFVMVPVEDYERLRRRERVAGRVEDLDDETLAAIRAVEPAPECQDAEARLQSSEAR